MNSFTKPEVNGGLPFSMITHLKTSKPESERDSGYSDAGSEYLSAVDLTDSEDTGRTVSAVNQDQPSSQVATMGGSYSGLSPMIILNNFILKQTDPVVPAAKQWGFPSSVEMIPQSQMVLLQPMVPNASSTSLKAASENHKESKTRLPILKSYPKIAPHPGEGTSSKRHEASAVRGGSRPACEQRHRRHHHGYRLHSSPSHRPGPQTPVKNVSSVEAAVTQAQLTADCQELCLSQSVSHDFNSGLLTSRWQDDERQDVFTVGSNNKRQRFSNTYNILQTSGLLGITLRTKQLIKENRRTQSQLHQLREQTGLLTDALSSGDPQLWTKLQFALQEKPISQ